MPQAKLRIRGIVSIGTIDHVAWHERIDKPELERRIAKVMTDPCIVRCIEFDCQALPFGKANRLGFLLDTPNSKVVPDSSCVDLHCLTTGQSK